VRQRGCSFFWAERKKKKRKGTASILFHGGGGEENLAGINLVQIVNPGGKGRGVNGILL